MSWGISRVAPGVELGSRVGQAVEDSVKYGANEQTRKLLALIAELAKTFATIAPDRMVSLETNGHVEGNYGSASVTLRVWP